MRARRLAAAFGLAFAFAWGPCPEAARAQDEGGASVSCTVAFVIDGDSFNCRDGTKVRLLLVNAPESGPFGDLARRALAGLLPVGETFTIQTDRERRDKQGRTLGYVFLADGQMVNELMIRQGYAFLKPSEDNRRYLPVLREAEAAARETRRGLWAR
ncbi:MAG TPA: thermonuclease family protein [Gemmatimonadota bacterium]|nr:thermonuclease family protein [Gemmatimonadota bacterium]